MPQPGDEFFIDPDALPPPFATPSVANPPNEIPRPAGAAPQVPEGFTVELVADDLGRARFIAAAPNGDILVSRPDDGDILVLRDSDGNGTAETVGTLAAGFDEPHAMELRPDGLYVVDIDHVWRLDYTAGDLAAGARVALTPAGALGPGTGHGLHSLAFSADGQRFHVGIGSASNDDPENPPRATILEFNLDGSGGHVVASGLRNPSGLAVNPDTGALFTLVAERDNLGDELVPDFLTQVEAGGFYGWPYAYIGPNPQPGLGDDRPDLVAASIVPDLLLQSHSTPIGLAFYDGGQFPDEYDGDAFVALRGSWNASTPRGFMIVHVPFEDGRPVGGYTAFATGFLTSDSVAGEAWGRPTGVAVAPDGSLLIADDTGGAVWRIRYAEAPGPLPALSIAPAQRSEGSSGSAAMVFTITLSAAATEAVTVVASTADGTAAAGSDYTATSAAVTIAAGATSGTFAVPILGDAVDEADETFTVSLSAPVNATLGAQSAATGTILDDDATPTVPGGDTIIGDGGPNLLQGGSDAERIEGGGGNDTVFGGGAGDTIFGGSGHDLILADHPGSGNDSVGGGGDNDSAFGGAGDDTLDGSAGDDLLAGDGGDDTLTGGDGNDVLFGGTGADSLTGGNGTDFVFGDAGPNTISGGPGNDRVHASVSDAFLNGSDGGFDMLVILDNVGGLTSIDLGQAANQKGTGNGPVLQGFEAVDASLASAGVAVSGAVFNGLGNVLFGSAFADQIAGSSAPDIMLGNPGADLLSGLGGADSIIADAGNDTVSGGDGGDVIFHPALPASGAVRVLDFTPGEDELWLPAAAAASPAQALALAQQVGADTVLTLAPGQSITLAGVSRATLGEADFAIV